MKREEMDRYVRRYVDWGEEQGWHDLTTCAARQSKNRDWYDLTGHERGGIFWPMAQQYRHLAPVNDSNLICNHNLFDIFVDPKLVKPLAAVLNSSWALLSKFQFGRPVGVEGNLKTEVIDVKMMLVPDPRRSPEISRQRAVSAFKKLAGRPAFQFLPERRMRRYALQEKYKYPQLQTELNKLSEVSELEMADRRELDDAVLEMMGIADPRKRKDLIDRLYSHLREFFESTRLREEEAIANKNRTRRGGIAKPESIADEVWAEIELDYPWADRYLDKNFTLAVTTDVKTWQTPKGAIPHPPYEVLGGWRVEFHRGKRRVAQVELPGRAQAEMLVFIASRGYGGRVWIPFSDEHAAEVLQNFREFVQKRTALFEKLVAERTDDEERQEKIISILEARVAGK